MWVCLKLSWGFLEDGCQVLNSISPNSEISQHITVADNAQEQCKVDDKLTHLGQNIMAGEKNIRPKVYRDTLEKCFLIRENNQNHSCLLYNAESHAYVQGRANVQKRPIKTLSAY